MGHTQLLATVTIREFLCVKAYHYFNTILNLTINIWHYDTYKHAHIH